jgi:hypothetical protein
MPELSKARQTSILADTIVSVKDFGAVGDGVTDDTAAILAASVQPKTFLPSGTYDTTYVNSSLVPGSWQGIGQITDVSNRKLPPWFANASSAPSSVGSQNSLLTAFTGDISKCQLPIGHYIQGAATLTQPTTGYYYQPESYPHYTYLYNSSGWNQSTSTNAGRTAACAYFTRVDNYGQGDCVAHTAVSFVTGSKPGATSFLANPAAVLFNGQCTAGSAGVLLGPSEYVMADQGFDVACVGSAMSMNRTNSTGALDCFWAGYRSQATGTQAIDQAYGVSGSHYIGVDMGIATITGSAMTIKANTKIHFNSTAADYRKTSSLGDSWITYESASAEFQIAGNSAAQFAVANIASAVSYFKVFGAATGGVPQFRTTGSDTNISAGYATKGNGFHFFYSNNAAAVQFAINGNQTSAVNYFLASGHATTIGPTLTAAGSDTNIDARIIAKGTGVVDLGTPTAGTAGGASGYMTIKVSGTSYKVPLYAL